MNVAEIAALDFVPVEIEENITPEAFQKHAAWAYMALGISFELLAKGPTELAELLFKICPSDPFQTVSEIAAARAWLENIAAVLSSTEARMLVALARAIN